MIGLLVGWARRQLAIGWEGPLTRPWSERGAEPMLAAAMAGHHHSPVEDHWGAMNWGTTSTTSVEPPEVCPFFVADERGRCEYCDAPRGDHTARALRDLGDTG